MRTKNEVILQDFVFLYHPSFKNDKKLQNYALSNPDWFNVEELHEETLNLHLNFKKTAKRDRVDGIRGKKKLEYKTGSVNPNPNANSKNNYRVEISSVQSIAGITKPASIISSVYNTCKDALDHFFIPQRDLDKLINSKGRNQSRSIIGSYNSKKDSYGGKLEPYRVNFTQIVKLV